MKILLLFSLLCFNETFFSQIVETFRVEKEYKESDFYPQIEGIFTDEISVVTLASSNGIVTNAGWIIQSFKISFSSGRDFVTVQVNSNVIPDEIIKEIVKSSLKEQIFFTDIIAIDAQKTKHNLMNMVLIPIPSDEK